MPTWTKPEALKELNRLIMGVEALGTGKRYSAEHTRWLANAEAFLEDVFGRESTFYRKLKLLRWQVVGTYMLLDRSDPLADAERQHQEVFRSDLGTAKGILQAASDRLERLPIEDVYEGKNTAPEASAIKADQSG